MTKFWPPPDTAEETDGGAEAPADPEKDRDAETQRDPALAKLLLHHSLRPELTDCVKYFVKPSFTWLTDPYLFSHRRFLKASFLVIMNLSRSSRTGI